MSRLDASVDGRSSCSSPQGVVGTWSKHPRGVARKRHTRIRGQVVRMPPDDAVVFNACGTPCGARGSAGGETTERLSGGPTDDGVTSGRLSRVSSAPSWCADESHSRTTLAGGIRHASKIG